MMAPRRARMRMVMRNVTIEVRATLIDLATRIKWFMSVLTKEKLDLMLQAYFGRRGRW